MIINSLIIPFPVFYSTIQSLAQITFEHNQLSDYKKLHLPHLFTNSNKGTNGFVRFCFVSTNSKIPSVNSQILT